MKTITLITILITLTGCHGTYEEKDAGKAYCNVYNKEFSHIGLHGSVNCK